MGGGGRAGTRRSAFWLPLLALNLASGLACAQGAATLEVKLDSLAPRKFGLAELAALPQAEIVEVRSVGAAQQEPVRWRGVLLRDVLDESGMGTLHRYDQRRSAVVVRATKQGPRHVKWLRQIKVMTIAK